MGFDVCRELAHLGVEHRGAGRAKSDKKWEDRLMKKLLMLGLAVILSLTMTNWSSASSLPTEDGLYHLLLLGIDTRDPENWDGCRTDTIIIVTINKAKNEIMFTSLMRDTYLSIPGKGNGRINAAYAYGGVDLTMQTIKANFGLTADGYIIFDFDAVCDLCDALGGIAVKMNSAEARVMNKAFPDAHFVVGENKLNGDQTQIYCRIRKGCGNDFERTRRQRDVLRILFSKVPSLGQDGILKLIGEKSSLIKTSIKVQDLIEWGILLYQMRGAEIFDLRIPLDGAYRSKTIKGAAVLVPNLAKNVKALQKFLNVETGTMDQPITLKSGDSGEEVRKLQDKLIQLGFLPGIASGAYDRQTADAVKKYQRANGLSTDGIAGPETLGLLYGT